MTTKSAASPPPRAAWDDLATELDAWAALGRTATFWWRDDDAVAPTPTLERLTALSREHAAPLALAVIPAGAEPALTSVLGGHPPVHALQHGWTHRNHAVPPAKKCELGADRPAHAVLAELAEGKAVLDRLFGRHVLPVLVPPWNRVAPEVVAGLPGLGFQGLSTYGPRHLTQTGVDCVNTHVDPVAWHRGRGFVGEAEALGMAVSHLAARRAGTVDTTEPTGLLTHHLAMDEETWAFTARFLAVTRSHAAARWLPADRLFQASRPGAIMMAEV